MFLLLYSWSEPFSRVVDFMRHASRAKRVIVSPCVKSK
jgi:hypothetical protein